MQTLTSSPGLTPLLAKGALLSPYKKLKLPHTATDWPRTPLRLPGIRIDLARLAAYERICGFATGEDAVPLTYPHVLGFPLAMRIMASRAFPFPLLGLVHTSVDITRHGELPATGEYELTVYVHELAPHRRGTEATVVTEMRAAGDLVWESRSTYLARHRTTTAPVAPKARDRKPLPAVTDWRLGGDVGRRYGSVSGDRNPIHLHPLTARLFGFPRAIAHGMWTVARCLAEQRLPESVAVRVRAEFRAPVLLPGTVTYAADGDLFELRTGDRLHLSGEVWTGGRLGGR
ncbi:MaoC/PaaZ C-terminal domain-containing protein [Streptomyces sp. NPDC002845]